MVPGSLLVVKAEYVDKLVPPDVQLAGHNMNGDHDFSSSASKGVVNPLMILFDVAVRFSLLTNTYGRMCIYIYIHISYYIIVTI